MDTGASSTIPPSPGSLPPPALTTVMASEMEVSNGFVKNGASLPYVIDTNKSGKFLVFDRNGHILNQLFLQAIERKIPNLYRYVESAGKSLFV